MRPPRVLIIAGSDSGGGAGLQADIKTVTALGGYAMTAVTAVTVQNTRGVFDIHAVPVPIVIAQIEKCIEDIGADIIKIGMLGDAEIVSRVAGTLRRIASGVPVVLDPVMVAKGGHPLGTPQSAIALRSELVPMARVITPNAPEAEVLTGEEVTSVEGQERAAARLVAMGAQAVLVKGGHVPGDAVVDVLCEGKDQWVFADPRIDSRATHGTGCTLASAIATRLGFGDSIDEAVALARKYLRGAMLAAPGFGAGHGPLFHGWDVPPLR